MSFHADAIGNRMSVGNCMHYIFLCKLDNTLNEDIILQRESSGSRFMGHKEQFYNMSIVPTGWSATILNNELYRWFVIVKPYTKMMGRNK